MIRPLLLLTILAVGSADAQQAAAPVDRILSRIDRDAFVSHFRFLSDDMLEGRGPGTRGGRLAAAYIAGQFERMGLTPAGTDSGWFQSFQLSRRFARRSELAAGTDRWLPGSEQALTILGNDTTLEYRGGVIFVGYGIVSTGQRWNDYKDVDVRGKLVIALMGHPGEVDSALFNGSNGNFSRVAKTLEAVRHGAAGLIMVHRSGITGFPWNQIASTWFQGRFTLAGSGESSGAATAISGWMRDSAAARLFHSGQLDFSAVAARAASRDFRPVAVPVEVTAVASTEEQQVEARNVVALWPGQGASASDVVVLGGHYDHLGIGTPVNGDSIYNGAEDNANGIAGLLTVAEAFSRSGVKPRRSVLFIAFDAEESGLLGSEAYVRSPVYPVERTVAMLNLDGLNVYARTTDTYSLGLELSSLAAVYRAAARAEGLTVGISAEEEKFLRDQNFFARSDHYNFARAGIPSLFISGGYSAVGHPAGWMQQKIEEYLTTRYHQPSDQMQNWYSYEGTMTDMRILARTLYSVAMAPRVPTWNPDSPYQRK
jgi:Zn-dependent M28 family amino/carboxypeptidase